MQPKKNKISGPYMSTLPNDEITNYFLSYIFFNAEELCYYNYEKYITDDFIADNFTCGMRIHA